MFQRQLSQSALSSTQTSRLYTQTKPNPRFQRQMTANQLLGPQSSSQSPSLASNLVGSQQNLPANLASYESQQASQKQRPAGTTTGKNKRIISRMLSISAIHTSSLLSGSASDSLANSEQQHQAGALPANGASSIIQPAATLGADPQQQSGETRNILSLADLF